jgi:nicotinate dehydrogenase subunit B
MTLPLSRRRLLRAGGALALAFHLPGIARGDEPRLPGSLARTPELNAWIRIGDDGTVTLLTGKVELGQGVLTALGQICAEELDVALDRVRIVSGDTAVTPNEGTTAGSLSMPMAGTAVRQASAEVRHILLARAALALGAPAASLTVDLGTVRAPHGPETTYAALAADAGLDRAASGTARPKPPAQYRIVGTPAPRRDLLPKLTGGAAYVHDLRLDGMAHGRVVRPRRHGAKLAAVDTAAVEAMPGVAKVVRNGNFLGVIAAEEEQAIAAAKALAERAQWSGGATLPGHAGIYDWLQRAPSETIPVKTQARADARPVARRFEATFRRPYTMHGAIGPSAAVAHMKEGTLTVYTHSQSVFETRDAIAELLQLDRAKVRLRHVEGSGCYGHNGADDAAADAALLAMALPGHPVRLQWMREDEHGNEPLGPAMVVKIAAGVGEDGGVLDWTLDLWSTSHTTRPSGRAGNLLAGLEVEPAFQGPRPRNGGAPNYAADRNAIALYDFPGQSVTTHFVAEMPLRSSALRALGAYANVFAIESFVDELAHAAGADPIAYRLRHLGDARARAVIAAAADRFGWASWRKGDGRGRGFAFARYKNLAAYAAVALEAAVDRASGEVRVVRAVGAIEAGQIVNPAGLANQMEGGMLQSISWTLKEEVRFDSETVQSRGWPDYPILTFPEAPEVEIVTLNRPGAPFLGAGEAAAGPTAAAVANAVFDATGKRVRDLPLNPERIKQALR